MITIDVAEYCSACMDFDPDVQRPQKAYGMSEEIVTISTESKLRQSLKHLTGHGLCISTEIPIIGSIGS